MHQLVYYSIFAIILYFVLSSVFETFSVEQENFDPSLVPVSSIVTLAKVAQKLVNGNGTLTNPGNLQIGATGTTPGGNLTVTGGINTIGFNGTVSMTEVNGSGTVTGEKGLTVGNLTIGRHAGDLHDYIRSGSTNGLLLSAANNNIFIWGKNRLYCQNDLNVTGTTTLNSNLIVGGPLTMGNNSKVTTGELQVNSSATVEGELSTNNGVFIRDRNKGNRFGWYTDDAGRLKLWVEKSYNGSIMTGGPAANVMDIDTNGSISLRTGAAFCIGNTCVDQGRLKNWIALETRVAALEGRAGALEGRAGALEGRAGTLETKVTALETNTIKVNDPISLWNWQGIDTRNNSVVWQSPNNVGNTIWFHYWGAEERPIASANGGTWKTLFRISR
jgi:hypothetical protein